MSGWKPSTSNRMVAASPRALPGPTLFIGTAAALGLLTLGVILFGSIIAEKNAGDTWLPDRKILGVLVFTLYQAGLSALLSLFFGGLLAWCLFHRRTFPGRRFLIAILPVGMVLPTLVVVLGLVTVFGRNGWINNAAEMILGTTIGDGVYGLSGILLAHCYLNATFVARAFLHQLEAIPTDRWKLGRSLGLPPLRRFMTIEWPAMAASVPGLGATVFLLCFTSFAIVLTMGGSPKFNTLEVSIYEAVRLDFDLSRAVTLSLVQMLVCASLVFAMSSLRGATGTSIQAVRRPDWPSGRGLEIAQGIVIIAFAAVFIGPLAAVVFDGLVSDLFDLFLQEAFRGALYASLLIALMSSGVTLALAIAISGAKCWLVQPGRLSSMTGTGLAGALIQFSGSLYLTVPSLVLGLGFFLVARNIGANTAIMAPVAVVTANVLMALPIALAVFVPAFQQTAARYDRLSFSLGIRNFSRWKRIEYPALKQDIGFIGALSFCFSFGDLGVIALFGNDRFSTLPWYLYQKMGAYRTSEAAGIAFIMLALTILVFLFVPRFFEGKRHA